MFNAFLSFLRAPARFGQWRAVRTDERALRSFVFASFALVSSVCAWALVEAGVAQGWYPSLAEVDANAHRGFLFNFLITVALVPLLEESVFRAPLLWMTRFNAFGILFHGVSLGFALVHLVNYELVEAHVPFLLFLVLPQWVAGLVFGYLRLTCGFRWAVAAHALHNALGMALR